MHKHGRTAPRTPTTRARLRGHAIRPPPRAVAGARRGRGSGQRSRRKEPRLSTARKYLATLPFLLFHAAAATRHPTPQDKLTLTRRARPGPWPAQKRRRRRRRRPCAARTRPAWPLAAGFVAASGKGRDHGRPRRPAGRRRRCGAAAGPAHARGARRGAWLWEADGSEEFLSLFERSEMWKEGQPRSFFSTSAVEKKEHSLHALALLSVRR